MAKKYSDSISSIGVMETDDALYNIGSISFNNIKDPEGIELFNQFAYLIRLEERGLYLIEEISDLDIDGLSLARRAFPTHSAFLFRAVLGGKRNYLDLGDDSAKEILESLSDDRQRILHSYNKQLRVLNANLKIQWTFCLQLIETRELFGTKSSLDSLLPKDVNREFLEQRLGPMTLTFD